MCLFFQVILWEELQHLLQQKLVLPWMTLCRQQAAVMSRCSKGSITDPLMTLPMAGQYFLHLRMRPEHLCVICLVMGYVWLDFTCYGGATNTTDMRDWAFWNVITKWLRSQSDGMLFGIIWRGWSRTYQWSHPPFPTHTNRFANSKVEGAKTWWLFIGQFLCIRTVAICLFVCSQVLVVTCYYYYPCLYDNQR